MNQAFDVINNDWSIINATAKERQHPKFDRHGNKQIITTQLDSFYIVETFEDISKGDAKTTVQFTSKKDTTLAGLYFDLKLPLEDYAKSSLQLLKAEQKPDDAKILSSGIKVLQLKRR